MSGRERVVFDCCVDFPALMSPAGPADRLVAFAVGRRVDLFASEYVLGEFRERRELAAEPKVRNKHQLTAEILDEFFETLATAAVLVETVPSVLAFLRDSDDAHDVDLALAAGAKLIVSRDKDLLSLTDATTADGRDFQTRFPHLAILTPSELLALLGEVSPDK